MKKIIIGLLALVVMTNCNKEKQEANQKEIDQKTISNYIDENELEAKFTDSGLYYTVSSEGAGKQPNFSSTVTVAYKGYLTDGQIFDESTSDGITFQLSNVIKGWQEGIPLYKEGGKGTLLIPSALGYGPQGNGSIPGNAVLLFDIHLIKVL